MNSAHSKSALELLAEEQALKLPDVEVMDCLILGGLAKEKGLMRSLPIAIEVRIDDWTIFHASLPGSSIENKNWIDRKCRVVNLKHHSTLYERISSEEFGVDWHKENKLSKYTYAVNGGGFPLITKDDRYKGSLIISGLTQIEDHNFAVEILENFLVKRYGFN